MESIDVHFHVVPLPFVEAVRADRFREAVQIEPGNGRERVVYHVPPGVAVEPTTTFGADSTTTAGSSQGWTGESWTRRPSGLRPSCSLAGPMRPWRSASPAR